MPSHKPIDTDNPVAPESTEEQAQDRITPRALSYEGVDIQITHRLKLNFAMLHNDVPLVSQISCTNRLDEPLRDIQLKLQLQPNFSQIWTYSIDELAPSATYQIDVVNLPLFYEEIVSLTERERGFLWLEWWADGEVRGRSCEQLEVLAYNEWSSGTLPELLASFVMPNHPTIAELLVTARDILERETGDPAFNGYQSRDPKRVQAMAVALFEAIQQQDITYCNPAANFEATGQKIRTPEQLLEQKMGTCLDLTVLYAACLEQAGLHPLLFLMDGHAFPGVWLVEHNLHQPTSEEPSRFRNRVQLDELLVLDSSSIVHKPRLPFERAVIVANRYLANDDEFRCAIDVRSARHQRILPLPSRLKGYTFDNTAPTKPPSVKEGPAASPITSPADSLDREATQPLTPETSETTGKDSASPTKLPTPKRLESWKQSLLDLTLRNRLLNFRETKQMLELHCPDLPGLENELAQDKSFSLLPKPRLLSENDPRSIKLMEARALEDVLDSYLRESFQQRKLHTNLADDDKVRRRLLELSRMARVGLQEGGVNTLYLAFGFLRWFESPSSEQERYAPLLLVPVELQRDSAAAPFRLVRTDEEARINVTLLEKLTREQGILFPEFDELPEHEGGLDLPRIFRIFRQKIVDLERWELQDKVYLGHFSFTKFLMWIDLDQNLHHLMESPVVRHLLEGKGEAFPTQGEFPHAERLDDDYAPDDIFCPLDADSSQLSAIIAASQGKSFVLQGPPGTGKSQTITNLIAHSLANNKSVLFVSDKMAALDVVHRRLANVGLGHFCLELHSHKARKKAVIDSLGEALHTAKKHAPEAWPEVVSNLQRTRQHLNAYIRLLHQSQPLGNSLFQIRSRLIGLRETGHVALDYPAIVETTRDHLTTLRDGVERLQSAARPVEPVSANPWRAVRWTEWRSGLSDQTKASAETLKQRLNALRSALSQVTEQLTPGIQLSSFAEFEAFYECATLLRCSPQPPRPLLQETQWEAMKDQLTAWIELGRSYRSLNTSLQKHYSDELYKLELSELHERFARWSGAFFLLAWLMLWGARRLIRRVRKQKQLPASTEIVTDLETAISREDHLAQLQRAATQARSWLGLWWKDEESDWEKLAEMVDWVDSFRATSQHFLSLLSKRYDRKPVLDVYTQLQEKAAPSDALPIQDSHEAIDAFLAKFSAYKEALQETVALLHLDEAIAWSGEKGEQHLDTVDALLQKWQQQLPRLRDWCFYRQAGEHLRSLQLGALTEAHETGRVVAEELPDVFRRSFYQQWIEELVASEDALRQFYSVEHERQIEKFQSLDKRYQKLAQSHIVAHIAGRLPTSTMQVSDSSEMGLLMRELKKQRRHKPIRVLFKQIPRLLRRLKPCLLMSPLSVAQYLDPGDESFDLVVFDEASQIPVHEAIGALARGKHAVIVGDSKQLPPTMFFQQSGRSEDIDNEDDFDELESILDECVAARLPSMQLRWHYRSRHEDLIAFSNYHYYNNALHTFPSAATKVEHLGVTWCEVPEGHYDQGKSRTNKLEAQALVAEVVRRLRDPDECERSIGIVTFSMAQQQLIEDLLEEARQQYPEIEPFFSDDVLEPLIVKNLENIQGDERDVMFFSICYGPDSHGRVRMNFGPLNREGGERRLNVAITRAREKLVVFSTLRPEQIDLSRTRAVGVCHLKTFLEYAQKGPRVIAQALELPTELHFDSPFEQKVYEALTAKGWELHTQVGCAGYRIDLGVVHPEEPGRYVLGIECDGANYHSAKAARDRDRLRAEVLQGLGWQLHRIWSTDWWEVPEREIQKAEDAIWAVMTQGSSFDVKRSNHGYKRVPASTQASSTDQASQETKATTTQKDTTAKQDGASSNKKETSASSTKDLPEAPVLAEPYEVCELPVEKRTGEQFYKKGSSKEVAELIKQVLEVEAPIHLQVLATRIVPYWSLSSITSRVRQRLEEVIQGMPAAQRPQLFDDFVWRHDQNPDDYREVRTSGDTAESQRRYDEIPIQEVLHAARVVLQQNVGLSIDDLSRAMARLLGFGRLGKRVDERMKEAIQLLAEREECRIEGDYVSV